MKTATIYQSILLLALLLCGMMGMAQDHSTKDNYTGNWTNGASWTDGTALSTTLGSVAVNIQINGEITVSALTIDGTENVNLIVNDTLIIEGDLTVNGTGTFDLDITSSGYFIVRGNFVINTDGKASYNFAGGGFFGVRGNYSISGSETGGMNSDRKYVMGFENSGDYDFRDRNDLVTNEDATTRKLFLGIQSIGFTATVAQPLCNGGDDGSITVQGTGGAWGYRYSIDNTTWIPDGSYTGDSHTFSGLAAGDYTIYVRDEESSENRQVTVGQPAVLSHTVTGNSVICPAGTGAFDVTMTGGTAPFTLQVTGQSDYETSDTEVLCEYLAAGIYTVNVTDANGCASTTNPQSFTVEVDNTPPSCEIYPDDKYFTISQFDGFSPVRATLTPVLGIPKTSVPSDADTLVYSINTQNFENLSINVLVSQTENAGLWEDNDSISFYLDYDLDGTGDYRIFYDYRVWTGEVGIAETTSDGNTTKTGFQVGARNLPAAANGESEIYLYIIRYTTNSDKEYIIEEGDIVITGKSLTATITTALSGEPVNCDDTQSPITVTSIDSKINWVECNVAGPREFWFTRTWVVEDDCGNENDAAANRVQRIMVGTPPSITAANDTIIDFCNAASVNINSPVYTDDCAEVGELTLGWQLFNESNNPDSGTASDFGTGGISNHSFAPPVSGAYTTYTIRWTVTDLAGFTAYDDQEVRVLAPIRIALAPPNLNFCTGESATFTITVSGGTGVYDTGNIDIDPDITTGGVSWSDNQGTFSTFNLELGTAENITITISDQTDEAIVGGCPSDYIIFSNGTHFFIHEKISTNAVERVD